MRAKNTINSMKNKKEQLKERGSKLTLRLHMATKKNAESAFLKAVKIELRTEGIKKGHHRNLNLSLVNGCMCLPSS